MAGSRVSLVLHDGNRITDRKPLAKALHDKTALEITRAFYGPAVETKSYEKLGEEVVGIGGLKKDDKSQTGLQLYVAIEVDGKVVDMGLPFVPGQQGEAFLNPANIRPGDIDSLLKDMPSNTEILLVWRLDRGMTQDIKLSGDSIISSMSPSPGNDYSLLDKKPCVSCGMGVGSKIDLVADISEIRLFCGDRDNPISMGTLLVAPPESFLLDSWNPKALAPSPLVQVQPSAAFRPDNAPGPAQAPIFMHADFIVRLSWEDSMRSSETAPPLLLQSGFYPEAPSGRQDMAQAAANQMPKPLTAALVFAICSSKPGVCQAEMPVVPAQSSDNRLITLIMNPAELRLWSEIYRRPAQGGPDRPNQFPGSAPLMAAPTQKPATRPPAIPANSQPATSQQPTNKFACGFHQLQQETIVKTVPLAPRPGNASPSLKTRQPFLVLTLKKMGQQPHTHAQDQKPLEQKKPRRRGRRPIITVPAEQKKESGAGLPAIQKHQPQKEARQKASKAPQQPKKPKQIPEAKAPIRVTKTKTRTGMANLDSCAKKKDARPNLLNQLLGLYRNSNGRKFRMKKNRAV